MDGLHWVPPFVAMLVLMFLMLSKQKAMAKTISDIGSRLDMSAPVQHDVAKSNMPQRTCTELSEYVVAASKSLVTDKYAKIHAEIERQAMKKTCVVFSCVGYDLSQVEVREIYYMLRAAGYYVQFVYSELDADEDAGEYVGQQVSATNIVHELRVSGWCS